MTARFGRAELPEDLERVLHKAVRIQWITIGALAVTVTMVFLAMGNSQAMKAAWIEDMLSFAPPIAFLVAVRMVNKPPSEGYPYGYHRATGVGHLVAAVALCAMGLFLLIDSGMGLLKGEHPPIGSVQLFGQTIWLGWIMMAVMAVTSIPPVILGRIKIKLAKELHNKVLYADADMNKADWMTAVGTILGVAGIGIGLWWADAAAALFIAASILRDGYKNMRGAITDLMDTRAMTFDDREPHPLIGKINEHLRSLPWVKEAGSRVRDQGHVFHVEAFVVPRGPMPPLEAFEEARDGCIDLDWKVQDVVVVPVPELPTEAGGQRQHQSERNL
ncbi:Co/Zn/Cd cation transporter [Arthrobacter crystallopoietes BAB-32]|uniref:Co/Zn/Cd cation transporter n=1 Tax=Arthrobacter crystallopoietes BAB-32 TaxID=1246476 RepID=N1V2J3_9MICC|nr:cation diffusion facilitator family transporter [Arthrobacter crystallopoietes]EMY32473.1 Co/Zn/Cd cation transporter [Arthrobacter crystallopoietes BAB-32]